MLFFVWNFRGIFYILLFLFVVMFVWEGVVIDIDMFVDLFLLKLKLLNVVESFLCWFFSWVDSFVMLVRLFLKLWSKVFRLLCFFLFGKNVGSGEFCDLYFLRSIFYGLDCESLLLLNFFLCCDFGMFIFLVLLVFVL